MKGTLLLLLLLCGIALRPQSNTEIYLFDLEIIGNGIQLTNKINISNNEGYDNQPSFYDEHTVIFASTRNGQTDIRQYDITSGASSWLTNTPAGSEYSPTRIPESSAISAIRLDTTGLQRLYRYDINSGKSKTILKEAKVGYHLWYSKDILVNTVLVENRMDLVVSHLSDGSNYTFQKNVGRSVLQIPNSQDISFLDISPEKTVLKSMDPVSGATQPIINTQDEQDFCWLPNGVLLAGKGNTLLRFHPGLDNDWAQTYTFEDQYVNNITRIAVNQDATQLAVVVEVSPAGIVQKQVETYNARDLEGFASCYSEDVLVKRFPNDTLYRGRKTMKQRYGDYFKQTASSSVAVLKRIVIGNTVIDEERAVDDGVENHQVAIYQVQNDEITSMTFLFEQKDSENPVAIVQQQLEAYNARNIDAFMATYSDDVRLFNYPNSLTSMGQEKMRNRYQGFFESTPDLNCEIKKRMIIGNKVIDLEYLTVNGQNFSAVAIYEVENGKIAKVTFIR